MILRSRFSARRARRGGFTLLEILLAALIAGLLLAALYAALYTTLLQTQATRDAVEAEDLSRGVFNKLSIDLTGTLAPLPPKSGGNSAGSGTTAAPASSGTAPATGSSAPTTGTGSSASGGSGASAVAGAAATGTTDPSTDATTPGATDNATASSADYSFQGGVVGDASRLVIYAGRVPEALGRYATTTDQVRADQRQIIYWFESGRGLYRRERPWVTADGVRDSIEADPDAPDSVLLAEEATNLTFEYCDGTSWVSSWDGTAPGPDGVTPLGPPRAIRVTLDLRIPAGRGEPVTKTVSQIIAVRSAPGTYTPPLLEAPTDGASDAAAGTDTGSTGTGGTSTGGSAGGSTGSGTAGSSAGKTGSGTTGAASGGSTGGKTGGSTGGTGGGSMGGSTGSGSSGSGNTGGRTGAGSGTGTGGKAGGTGGGSTGGK